MDKFIVAIQEWVESEDEKTGWLGQGWVSESSNEPIDDDSYNINKILESDKFGNPIKAEFMLKPLHNGIYSENFS